MLAFGDRFIALVFAIGVLVSGVLAALTTGAQAGPYEDALSRFSADSFDQTIEGINEVAASGNPLAAPVITALQEGRLLFSAESKVSSFASSPTADRRRHRPTGRRRPPRPTSRRCGSTTGCGGSSTRRSAA